MHLLRLNDLHASPRSRLPGGAVIALAALLLLGALVLTACQAETGVEGGPGTPAVSNPTYTADIAPLLSSVGCTSCHGPTVVSTRCDGCHSGARKPTDSYMNSLARADMVSAGSAAITGDTIVSPSSSNTSVLYWVVTQDARYVPTAIAGTNQMLAMMDLMSASEKQTVKNWIDQGATQ